MSGYSLSHVPDPVSLRGLASLVAQERATTAALLAHLGEVDARRLYLRAGFPSMSLYCIRQLGLCEDAAHRRIQAARTARRFPAIFAALAEGRLHLAGVVLLAPHLTEENADELLRTAAGKRESEIEELLAQRFPRSELLPPVQALPAAAPGRIRNLPRGKSGTSPSPQGPCRHPPRDDRSRPKPGRGLPASVGGDSLRGLGAGTKACPGARRPRRQPVSTR